MWKNLENKFGFPSNVPPDAGDMEFDYFLIVLALLWVSAIRFWYGLANAILQDLFGCFCFYLLVEVDKDGNVVERKLAEEAEERKRSKVSFARGSKDSPTKPGGPGGGGGNTRINNTLLSSTFGLSPSKEKQTRNASKERPDLHQNSRDWIDLESPAKLDDDEDEEEGEEEEANREIVVDDGGRSAAQKGFRDPREADDFKFYVKAEAKRGWLWFLGKANKWYNKDISIADAHASVLWLFFK